MKRILSIVLSLCLILSCAAIFGGCNTKTSNDWPVTIGDVTKIQRILAGLEEDEGGIVSRRCNVDGNKLSVTDATAIQRYLARYPNVFNIEETAKDYGKVKENYELPFIPD